MLDMTIQQEAPPGRPPSTDKADPGDTIELDCDGVYRIRTEAGVLLGTEYGGYPLALDTPLDAEDLVERRRVLHKYLKEHSQPRGRYW